MSKVNPQIAKQLAGVSLLVQGALLLCLCMNFSRAGVDPSLFGILISLIPLYIGLGVLRGSAKRTIVGIVWLVLVLGVLLWSIYVAVYGPFYSEGGGYVRASIHPLGAFLTIAWALATIILLRVSLKRKGDLS